jgi:hypothetical protein
MTNYTVKELFWFYLGHIRVLRIKALLEIVWVILGVERVEYTDYCRLSCLPRGR